MGGDGKIGGGCWVCFEVDGKDENDRKQCISAVDVPGAVAGQGKTVTITYPGGEEKSITLGRTDVIRISWGAPKKA